jgi:ribonuclease E
MKKEMLINVLQPEECRIAIVEDGILEELYVERTSQESYVGNIYKGRIVNIEPSIQAAFVDFGIGRNGFLHVSDVEPAYYRHLEPRRFETGRRDKRSRGRGRAPATDLPEELQERYPEPESLPDEPELDGESTGEDKTPAEQATPSRGSSRDQSRSRGRGRRRPERSADQSGEVPEDESHPSRDVQEAPPQDPEPSPPTYLGTDEPPDRPLPMDSAEHRTEENAHSSEQSDPLSTPEDQDIFFPRSQPKPESFEVGSESEPLAEEESLPESELHRELALQAEEFEGSTEIAEPAEAPPPDLEPEGEEFRPRRRPLHQDRRGRMPRRMMGRPGAGRPKPLIQDIFRRGQEVLVQVIKEGIGTKGPTLSTYISIAGRYLVLMPGLNRVGVSRKIADDEQRRRLREIFHELQPPRGLGFIIRTAGIDKTKKELQRDLAYLARLWQVVVRRIRKTKSPAEIYQESDMITRTIRDTFTSDIDTIWVDEPQAFEHAQEFLQIVMPRYASRINHYTDSEPLFHKYGIEDEIARIQQRHVPLPNGGSIVIDQTEALVAIDVNSGNFRADNNAEETAYQMNLLAAKEIARQLRLRDLGGVIVNDFIDMRDEKHRRDVERALRDAVKRDRARTKILRISAFGLIEMTRQRIRPSLKRSVYQDCAHCLGTGQVKTCESMSIDVMRMLQLAAHRENVHRIQVRVQDEVASYLLNRKRREITRLEESGDIQVSISGVLAGSPEMLEFVCYDNNNNEVKFLPYDENRQRRR